MSSYVCGGRHSKSCSGGLYDAPNRQEAEYPDRHPRVDSEWTERKWVARRTGFGKAKSLERSGWATDAEWVGGSRILLDRRCLRAFGAALRMRRRSEGRCSGS